MSGVNKVILVGRLGKDPEVRTFENGSKKVSFPLATSETYKDKEGRRVEQTEWHNIICWRNLADIAEQYLNKGKLIYLEGRLRTRSWEDNGLKKYITEIEATTFTMLGSKSEEGENSPERKITTTPSPATEQPVDTQEFSETDDLPF